MKGDKIIMDYKRAWKELMDLCLERERAYISYSRKEKLQELRNVISQMKEIEEGRREDKYRRIFVEFNRYTKKDTIFYDNDGEVIKSEWEEIVNRNS